jgi:hypothetical protein
MVVVVQLVRLQYTEWAIVGGRDTPRPLIGEQHASPMLIPEPGH